MSLKKKVYKSSEFIEPLERKVLRKKKCVVCNEEMHVTQENIYTCDEKCREIYNRVRAHLNKIRSI